MATIRPYDPADLGRVLALWDGQVWTRPSLSEEIVAGFDEDVREFARD